MSKEFKEGDRVTAPYDRDGTGQLKSGKIQDVLSVMYFIHFDDGTEDFYYKVDANVRKENND